MESIITVNASSTEMASAIANGLYKEYFIIRDYKMSRPGFFITSIEHSELMRPLFGTFTLSELKETIENGIDVSVYTAALKHFGFDAGAKAVHCFNKEYAEELVFCYENGKSLSDYERWTRYETLLDEAISFDEFSAIDSFYGSDPNDIDVLDTDTIFAIRNHLLKIRSFSNDKPSLDDHISAANAQKESFLDANSGFVFKTLERLF